MEQDLRRLVEQQHPQQPSQHTGRLETRIRHAASCVGLCVGCSGSGSVGQRQLGRRQPLHQILAFTGGRSELFFEQSDVRLVVCGAPVTVT